MTGFTLSSAAQADLEELAAFVAADSSPAAHRLILEIHDAIRRLVRFPGIGHRRRDTSDDIRLWRVRSTVIVYRPAEEGIDVLRVVSGWRDLGRLLGGDPDESADRFAS